jgi:regulator of replication initiation timing
MQDLEMEKSSLKDQMSEMSSKIGEHYKENDELRSQLVQSR